MAGAAKRITGQRKREATQAQIGTASDELQDEATKRGQRILDSAKGLFRFLTGEEVARPASQPVEVREQKVEKEAKGWFSSVTGVFSGIKGSSQSSGSSGDAVSGSGFAEGEVHADLVMVRAVIV